MADTSDHARIGDLVERYATLVDHRDFDAVADLFTADGMLILPDPPARMAPVRAYPGREQILRALSVLRQVPATRHEVKQVAFAVADGADMATGTVAGVAHHFYRRRSGGVTDVVWHVRYADTYRRDNGLWRIARRALRLDRVERREVVDCPDLAL